MISLMSETGKINNETEGYDINTLKLLNKKAKRTLELLMQHLMIKDEDVLDAQSHYNSPSTTKKRSKELNINQGILLLLRCKNLF